ncbi:MAG: serine/threonine protein kinase [Planctomycetes bacterium]|nr:serine/threonine protein kinase [Planctomycetota bacterium]
MGDSATEHALAVAREAIAVGLVDRETALRLYKDYTGYVERGIKASFTRLLLSRGEIDNEAFSKLQQSVPPPAHLQEEDQRSGIFRRVEPAPPAAQASGVFRAAFPSDRYPKPEQEHEEDAVPDLTMDYDAVLSPPMSLGQLAGTRAAPAAAQNGGGSPPAELPDLTMDYDAVLAPPMAFPGAPAASAAPPALAPSTAPKPKAPAKSASGDYSPIGLDSTAEASKAGYDLAMDATEAREKAFFSVDSEEDDEESGEGQTTLKEPEVGGQLDNYALKKVIGRGGMGVIYLVENLDDHQEYALKALTMVNRGSMGKKRRARFQREVNALRRLEHPNLIKVHTCGRAKVDGAGPYDYYVMDLVEGRELKALLKSDELRRREKLQIFADICKAVAHAHERGVIHRDLKPANVLVSEAQHVTVLDFGLAKVTDGVGDLTRTGSALGTPYYMAPEQLLNPKDVDARSDVFALGVILYEMMVGKRPFTGQTAAEVGTKIMNHEPERPSKANPNLDVSIDAVILKALAKDTEVRYQSVGDLLREVSRLIGGRGVKANTTDLQIQGAASWAQTNAIPMAVGFAAATAVWWFFGFVYWLLF